jgi:hypothetical protein
MLPGSGLKVCGGGGWWVCNPISVISLGQADQLNVCTLGTSLFSLTIKCR